MVNEKQMKDVLDTINKMTNDNIDRYISILNLSEKVYNEKISNKDDFYTNIHKYIDNMDNIEKWIVKFWVSNIVNLRVALRYTGKNIEEFDKIAFMSTFMTYSNGYCYHFSKMLESVFGNGHVCWAAPYKHFCYVEEGIAYDISGKYKGAAYYMIPENYMGLTIFDFLQDDMKHFDPSAEELISIIKNYCRLNYELYDDSIEGILKYIDMRHNIDRIDKEEI